MTARFASVISKYTHGTEFNIVTTTGGNLTAGSLWLFICAVNRAGRTYLSDGYQITFSNNDLIRITLNSSILNYSNGEDIYKIIIAGNSTNNKTTASQLAIYEVKESNQTTIKTLPAQIDLTKNAHKALAQTVATSANLPNNTDLINGMVRFVTATGLIYRYDANAVSGVYSAVGGTGYWVLHNSYGFYPNIVDITTDGGANCSLNQISSPLLAPDKIGNADSIPIRYIYTNGDTDDGGSALPVGTYLTLKPTINGQFSDVFGTYASLFSGLIKTTLKGYYNPITRALNTTITGTGIEQTWTEENSPMQLLTALPRGQYAVFDIYFDFTVSQLQNRILESDEIGLDIINKGVFSYPSKLYNLTGSIVYKNQDRLRIYPTSTGVLRGTGSATIGNNDQGWDTPIVNEQVYAVGLVADTEDQIAAISGSRAGDIRILQNVSNLDLTEKIRAYVSTKNGVSNPSLVSNSVSLNANDRLSITVSYPFNGTTLRSTIRSNYPDVIANYNNAQIAVNKLTIYVVKDGTIYELANHSSILLDSSQTITIDSLASATIIGSIPTNADPYFCLYNFPLAPTIAKITGGGSLVSGSYSVYVAYSYPSPNTKLTGINHSPDYQPFGANYAPIEEADKTYAEFLNSLDFWRDSVSNLTALRALSSEELVNGHTRFVISNNSLYCYNSSDTTADDNDIYIEPTNGVGCFIKQRNITHIGEVTGEKTLTLNKTAITNKDTVTPVSGDFVLISDTSDSGNLKKVDTVSFLGGAIADGDKGDITVSSSGSTWTIDNLAVTYAKIQNVSDTNKILGRVSSGAGVIEEIACTSFGRSLIDDIDAVTARTTLGLGSLATQSGTFSGTSSGTNTGDQNLFSTIAIAGQNSIIANTTSDTLTIIAGSNIVLTTNATNDELTISFSGTGGSFASSDITTQTLVTVAPTDNLIIADASDSYNLKKIVASDLINLSSDTNPTLSNNLNIGSYAIVDTNSNEFLKFSSTASAVNEFTITNNSTGNSPKLSVTGNDTNIGLTIEAKGSGIITVNSPVNFTKTQDMVLVNVGSGVNFDQSLGNVFTRDAVNGTVTFTVSNVTTSYHIFTLLFTYTSGTVNWFSGITWDGSTTPTLTGGKIYEFTFKTYNGGTNWYGAISFNN